VLSQIIVLSVVPLRVIPPPFALASVGEATELSSILGSSTVIVTEFTVVVVPLTVRFPLTVTVVFVLPRLIALTPVPIVAIFIVPVVIPAPIAIDPVVTVG
jgi:hypothetical protein